MQENVIEVRNVSKLYRLGTIGSKRLVDDFRRSMAKLRGKEDPLSKISENGTADRNQAALASEIHWALRDVSFDVKRGEVLGVIGRNGAGKSTILKILSRVTAPTTGEIRIRGRIASLLEVGTGFNPELSGRDNVYLNASILGMSKVEIEERFDDIVKFAEVEKFLDTPVKRYSSGMYVRLAFAVAAHLDPEILVVDEVLAVGDAAFQEKCLGKMEAVAGQGRTVLLVSHNMSTIQHLCTRCILFRNGVVHKTGKPDEVVGEYLSDSRSDSSMDLSDWKDRHGSGEARISELQILNEHGEAKGIFPFGGTICFRITAKFDAPLNDPMFGVLIQGSSGESIVDLQSSHCGMRIGKAQGLVVVEGTMKNVGLYPGKYYLTPWISDGSGTRSIDMARLCANIQIIPKPNEHGDMKLDGKWGKYWVPSEWTGIQNGGKSG